MGLEPFEVVTVRMHGIVRQASIHNNSIQASHCVVTLHNTLKHLEDMYVCYYGGEVTV